MRQVFTLLAIIGSMMMQAQTFTILTDQPRQTIEHFGASDAWSMQNIGLWEEEAEQQKIADWLFSTGYRPLRMAFQPGSWQCLSG